MGHHLVFHMLEAEFDKVVFLYHLEQGKAGASYGLNVASLAGLPDSILQTAQCKSKKLEAEVTKKMSCKERELCSLLRFLDGPHVSLPLALRNYPFVL